MFFFSTIVLSGLLCGNSTYPFIPVLSDKEPIFMIKKNFYMKNKRSLVVYISTVSSVKDGEYSLLNCNWCDGLLSKPENHFFTLLSKNDSPDSLKDFRSTTPTLSAERMTFYFIFLDISTLSNELKIFSLVQLFRVE